MLNDMTQEENLSRAREWEGADPAVAPGTTRTFLVVAVSIAALLRIMWAWHFGLSMEQEGVEYARLGENLLHGHGYVGIFNNGVQLNFPPLYPVLIALVTLFTRNAEVAARAINIASGCALVLPIFAITRALSGWNAAVVATVLVVLHPALIAGGASTYAEGPYLTLLITAVFFLVKWVEEQRPRRTACTGAFLGLAYLVRPEAFLFAGVFVGCLLLASLWATVRRPFVIGALWMATAFALVALPNVVFLTMSTGKVRIEAKGTLAYHWGQRINSGMSYNEAIMGIGDDLTPQGVFMKPNLEVINAPAPPARAYLAFLAQAARRNARDLLTAVVEERAFGSPVLFVLVVLGLFRQPWNRRQFPIHVILLITAGLLLFVLLTVQALWLRYFYALFGVLLIWTAQGTESLRAWGRASASAIVADARIAERVGVALKWAAVAAVLMVAARALPTVDQFGESRFPERKEAGRWIAARSTARPWVMDTSLQVPYYSGGDLKLLPYANADLALKFIAKEAPDFIVLHRMNKSELPYSAQWFDEGIPDRRAELVYDRDGPQDQIKIYRWNKAE